MGVLHQRDLLEISTYDEPRDDVADVRVVCPDVVIEPRELPGEPGADMPVAMAVGKPLYNWTGDVLLSVKIVGGTDIPAQMPEGECKLLMYSHGLAFNKGPHNYYLSDDQILAVYPLTQGAVEKRQHAGGAINPDDATHTNRLVLEFRDLLTGRPAALIMDARRSPRAFLLRLKQNLARKYEPENRCRYVYNIFGEGGEVDPQKLNEACRHVPAYVLARYVSEVTDRPLADVIPKLDEALRPYGREVGKPQTSRWVNIAILLALGFAAIGILASI